MNILGVGPLELLFIFLIALIVLGPKDILKASQTMGRWLRTIIKSDTWRIIRETSREIRNIPTKMMRESGLDEIKKSLPTEADIRNSMGYDDLQSEANKISTDLTNITKPSESSSFSTPSKPTSSSGNIKNQQPGQKPPANQEPPSSDWTTPRPKIIRPEPAPEIITPEISEADAPIPALDNQTENKKPDSLPS
jgi:Sec-independent protein translocase protein TatA